MKANIVFFNTIHNQYMYDGDTGKILAADPIMKLIIEEYLNEDIAYIIEKLKEKYGTEAVKGAYLRVEEAKKQGMLMQTEKKIFKDLALGQLEYELANNVIGVCLSVTQSCNLRCEYCIYSGIYNGERTHSEKSMSLKTAQKAIDYAMSKGAAQNIFHLSFYGGEPLLRFDFIRQCIAYIESEYPGKRKIYNITTNGTLLKDEYVRFLEENKVMLHISLDGPKEYHDEYRKFAESGVGSFDIIKQNLLNIKNNYNEYYKQYVTFGVTVSPFRSLAVIEDFLYEGDIAEEENYARVSKVNEGTALSIYDDKKTKENIKNYYEENLFTGIRYIHAKIHNREEYLKKSKVAAYFNESIDKLHKNRVIKSPDEYILPSGCCNPGASKLYVSAEGGYFICEKCNEKGEALKLGDVDCGIDINKVKSIVRDFYSCTEEECAKCFAYIYCTLCPMQIEDEDRQSRDKKLKRCSNVRKGLIRDLTCYLTILEKNPYAFD